MIEKTHLRVGNLVYTWDTDYEYGPGNQFLEVVEELRKNVAEFKTSHAAYYEIEPIELTPEWLERCGLKDKAGNRCAYRMNINSVDELCWYMDDEFIRYQSIGCGFTRQYRNCKHVHQLQNLYYCLTDGKELEIKLP